MRDIKDYLHLYLGCEVYVFPDETLTNGWLETKRKEMPGLTYQYQLTISNYNVVLDAGYKPILRPLSDMTDEEMDEVWHGIEPKNVLVMQYKNSGMERKVALCSERTRYLLSRGFDLFNLIEEGLAVKLSSNNS